MSEPAVEQLQLPFQRCWNDLTEAEKNKFIWEASDGFAGVDPKQFTSLARNTEG